jgi:hypothetical protein
MLKRVLPSLMLLVLVAPIEGQAPRPMTFIHLLNVPNLTDPQLSPDGRQLTCTTRRASSTPFNNADVSAFANSFAPMA